MALLRQDWERAGRRKKTKNAAATGPYGPGDAEHNVYSRQPQDRWRGRTGQPPQVPRCSTQPSEKNLRRDFFDFYTPRQTPQARCARRKGKTMQIDRETGEILEDGSEEELAEWMQLYRATRERQTPSEPQDDTCPF